MEYAYILEPSSSFAMTQRVKKCEIIKRTPSGQIVVKRGEGEQRFDAKGYEMGASKYHRAFLIDEGRYEKIVESNAKIQRMRDAKDAAVKVAQLFNNYSGLCSKEELKEALKEALVIANKI